MKPHRFGSLFVACLIFSCVGSDEVTGPPPPFATAVVIATTYTEAFTGTTGALSGTWTQQRTSGTINRTGSGSGVGSVNAKDLFAFWSANSFNNDQYSQVRIVGGLAANSQYVTIMVRASGRGEGVYNGYLFYTDGLAGTGHTEVAKNINGSQITLRSFPTSFATGDVIKIDVVGTTVTCYKNGIVVGTITDSSLPSGSAGVGVYGSLVTIDDWEGGSLATGAPPAAVATVTVSPASASIAAGSTQPLSATTKDAAGNTLAGRTVTWTSDAPSIATVNASTGLVSALASGVATITATSEGQVGTSSITVTPAPVATVTVAPSSVTIVLANTQQLIAVTKDGAGVTLSGRVVTWTSDNAAATVDASGLVTAAAMGTATITATSEGKKGTSSVTVTPVAVASVTVMPASTNLVVGATQQLTATTNDASGNTVTGRSILWSSNNPAVASVNGATGVVTAVAAGGPVTITATSEGKSGTASVAVTAVPVATVTVGPSPVTVAVGRTQPLVATLRDANNNVLSGRVVTWSSDATSVAAINATSGVVTGMSVGSATITAASEGQSGTSTITVTPSAGVAGPLRVSAANRRYFADPTGRIVYLTGSHYWKNLQDNSPGNPPAAFDNTAYLNFLQSHNHNFTRLWMWEQSRWSAETSLDHYFSPTLYVRTGPGNGADGGLKFDLNQLNPAYLARVRQRVMDAGARGIYVSVMLFDGWSVETKPGFTSANPWVAHPFNSANNINGINGDPNGDLSGRESQTLAIPAVTALQDAYVRAVVDAVNDLDNVIYEISNETDPSGNTWQYHMIALIRSYEATKPKQHPIGMTVPWPGSNSDVFASSADWISMNGSTSDPWSADGSKVSLLDTDHLCGICGDAAWVWKAITRGHNPLLMDGYDGSAGVGDPAYNKNDPVWEQIRTNLGYARSYAVRMDLSRALPRGDLASSGYCLAVVGSEYLVFQPYGGRLTVNLASVHGTRVVEWFNPANGQTIAGPTVTGGVTVRITPPFSGPAVAYIHP